MSDLLSQAVEDGALDAEIVTVESEPSSAIAVPKSHKPDDPMYALIETALERGNADALEQVVSLYNTQQDRELKREFEAAFAAMQAEIPAILASRRNNQTNSSYAALDDIHKHVKPVLREHGFSIRYESPDVQPEGFITATCILTFKNGWSAKNTSSVPIDNKGIKGSQNKTDTHGAGSATTYARRYSLCGLLDITVTDDDDGNAAGGAPKVTQEQQSIIMELLHSAPDDTRIAFHGKYPSVKDVPINSFKDCISWLKAAIAQVGDNGTV